MKKDKLNVIVIMLLIVLLIFPIYSNADLAIDEYKIIYEVINQEGAILCDENGNKLTVIPYGEKIEEISIMYIASNTNKGYFNLTYNEISGRANFEDFKITSRFLGSHMSGAFEDENETNIMQNVSIALMCIGVAILIAVYAIVTIQLINKRKNRNNESENEDGENKKSSNK